MKRKLFTMLLAICAVYTQAAITFSSDSIYRIQCVKYGAGGVALGANHGGSSPLYYVLTTNTAVDQYWQIIEKSTGKYAIRNVSTKQYITHNGNYSPGRYITMTDELNGDSSLWVIGTYNDSICYIQNVAEEGHIFDVRSSYIIGTYAHVGTSAANNEQFQFFFKNGARVGASSTPTPTPTPPPSSSNYGNESGYYWENTGLSQPFVYTTDKTNPVLYYIKNVRSGNWVTGETNGNLTETPSQTTAFYFVKGSDGANIYTSGGRYISGAVAESSYELTSTGVQAVSGTTTTSNNTWTISHYTAETNLEGYTIAIKTCTSNVSDGWWKTPYDEGYIYWNDYSSSSLISFYLLDGGGSFLFYSNDARHKAYLESQGMSFTGGGGSTTAVALTSYLDSLQFNNKATVYDKKYLTYMQPVSQTYIGKEYNVKTHFVVKPSLKEEGATYTLKVGESKAADNGNINFGNIEGGTSFTLKLYKNDTTLVAYSPITFTFMPIVEVFGTYFPGSSVDAYGNHSYGAGTIRVNDGDVLGLDSLYNAGMRYRGATASGQSKKAYAIKLRDAAGNDIDRQLIGLRSDNNWILDAMAIDPGRMRNRVTTDLWNDYSTKPYYYKSEPKLINGTRGKMVEVLLNGSYAGIYCMTEKVDRKQLKLKKIDLGATTETADTIHGVLYKSTSWSYEIFMGHSSDSKSYPMTAPSTYSNTSYAWKSWNIKYPDLGDGDDITWEPLYTAVDLVAHQAHTTFVDSVSTFFDLPVFRDYYLLIELNQATDNHGKNMYLYAYNINKHKNRKISAAPWDMDGTWGRRWDGSSTYTSDASADYITFLWNYEHGEHTLYKRLVEYDYNNWADSLATRYAQLRSTWFTVDKLLARFTNYRNLFKESGADTRENSRWGSTITMDFDNEMTYLKEWITKRLDMMDKEYGYTVPTAITENNIADFYSVTGGKGCILVHSNTPRTIKVYTLTSIGYVTHEVQAGVTKIDNIPAGVYVVGDKKVLVR